MKDFKNKTEGFDQQISGLTLEGLFADKIEVFLVDVERASEFYARLIIPKIEATNLRDGLVSKLEKDLQKYLKSVIVNAILHTDECDNPSEIRKYTFHTFKNLMVPSLLAKSLMLLGRAKYPGVNRVVGYSPEKVDIMSESEASDYSHYLENVAASLDINFENVSMPKQGKLEDLALVLYSTENEKEVLASHLPYENVNAPYISSLFPSMKEPSTSYPLTSRVGDHRKVLDKLKEIS